MRSSPPRPRFLRVNLFARPENEDEDEDEKENKDEAENEIV